MTTSLRLGSSELVLTSATDTDEVSLPYIDDISPRELKAAEVMVKEEVRRDFFLRVCVRAFDRSIDRSRLCCRAIVDEHHLSDVDDDFDDDRVVGRSLYPFLSQMENRCAGCRNAKRTTWLK